MNSICKSTNYLCKTIAHPKKNDHLWKILPVSRLNTIFFTPFFHKQTEMLYILIKKYPTFQSKSIPLTNLNGTTSFITNDKYVYKTGDYN